MALFCIIVYRKQAQNMHLSSLYEAAFENKVSLLFAHYFTKCYIRLLDFCITNVLQEFRVIR